MDDESLSQNQLFIIVKVENNKSIYYSYINNEGNFSLYLPVFVKRE